MSFLRNYSISLKEVEDKVAFIKILLELHELIIGFFSMLPKQIIPTDLGLKNTLDCF